MFVCVECGEVEDCVMVPEWVDKIWLNGKRSVYIRNRHIKARVEQFVYPKYCSSIVEDFIKVVDLMVKNGMIKKNVSRYDYYIIRLASRRGATLIMKPTDLRHSKTKKNHLMTNYSVQSAHH